MFGSTMPPRPEASLSRASSRSSSVSRGLSMADARIIRNAEILREQLIRQHVFLGDEKHDHDIVWKTRDVIQRESARIRDDLLSCSPPRRRPSKSRPGRSPDRSRSPTPSPLRSRSPTLRERTSSSRRRRETLHSRPFSPTLSPRRFDMSPVGSVSPERRDTGRREALLSSALPRRMLPVRSVSLSPDRPKQDSNMNSPLSGQTRHLSVVQRDAPNRTLPIDCSGRTEEIFNEIPWDEPTKSVQPVQKAVTGNLDDSFLSFYSAGDLSGVLGSWPTEGDASQCNDVSTDETKLTRSTAPSISPPLSTSTMSDPPPPPPPLYSPPRRYSSPPPPPPHSPPPPPLTPPQSPMSSPPRLPLLDPPSPSDTPITFMGRDRKLRTKSYTYVVEPLDYGSSYFFDVDDDYVDDALAEYTQDFSTDEEEGEGDEDVHAVPRPATPAKQVVPFNGASLIDDDESVECSVEVEEVFVDTTEERQGPPPSARSEDGPTRLDKAIQLALSNTSAETIEAVVETPVRKSPTIPASDESLRLEKALKLALSSPTADPPLVSSVEEMPRVDYSMLLADPAYLHAQKAGFLWQSLVGQHVRFPSRWWNGARSPPMGDDPLDSSEWQYRGRYTVRGHDALRKLVRNRGAAGRLLLHIVVQDLMTHKPVQDIAVGCYHPNARGIRKSAAADESLEDCRDVWIAVRKRCSYCVSVLDHLLKQEGDGDKKKFCTSPLGRGRRVTNQNVRVVYGEKPPMETIFCPESEVFERLSSVPTDSVQQSCPPLLLLEDFVFR